MKKFLALSVALALCFSAVGCGSNSTDNNTNSDMIDSTTYRVGIGSYTATEDSSSAVSDDNGKTVVDTTYATVIFDENNIIQKVYIDQVETKVYFDSKGQLVNESAYNDIRSKRELGDEYGMKAASNIGKEWYEQINSLESWLVGKNIAEISDSVMNMNGYGTDNDYANNIVNGAENMMDGVVDGAENIADGIVNGANDMMGNNSTDGTNTAEGITNDTNDNNMTGDTQNNSMPTDPNSTSGGTTDNNTSDDNANSGDANNTTGNALDWEEDLKASVTIDLTNIQRALHKAYMNAR